MSRPACFDLSIIFVNWTLLLECLHTPHHLTTAFTLDDDAMCSMLRSALADAQYCIAFSIPLRKTEALVSSKASAHTQGNATATYP